MSSPTVVSAFRVPMQKLSPEDQGFRAFVVEDPDGVELPGCLEVHEVRLDGHTMPPHVDHTVPTDTTDKNFKELRLHNYQLTEGPRGNPVLLRSLNSNDGKWQKGAVLHVKGKWSDDAAPDGLDAKKMDELKAIATELGIPSPVGTKKPDLIAAIRAKQVPE